MKNLLSRYVPMMFLGVALTFAACSGGSENEAGDTSNMDDTEEVAESNNQAADGSSQATLDETNKTVDGKLNINTASGEAFRTIPNVGDKMVHEFEEYRPYVSIQQFRREIGKYVDEDQVAEYENYIYVPIHRNDSDMASLLQIPGLDEEEATELIGMRPFDSDEVFAEALTEYLSDDELVIAKGYLKAE